MIAINDGFAPLQRKHVPKYEVKYYPTVLLYKPDGQVVEFAPENQQYIKYEFNFNGLTRFINDEGCC